MRLGSCDVGFDIRRNDANLQSASCRCLNKFATLGHKIHTCFSPTPVNELPNLPGGQITMSIARSQSELEDAFGLVYRSYVRAGLDSPNPTGLRVTKYHFLPTTEVILARNAGVPIATASLIVDGELGLARRVDLWGRTQSAEGSRSSLGRSRQPRRPPRISSTLHPDVSRPFHPDCSGRRAARLQRPGRRNAPTPCPFLHPSDRI